MKIIYPVATAAVLALLVGCSDNEKAGNGPNPEKPVSTKTQGENETDAMAKKNEFVGAIDKKLSELDGQIAELAKKAESYKDDAKIQTDKTLTDLREQRDRMKTKFDELKKSSDAAWNDLKAGVDSALDELEKAYEQAKSKFN